MIDYDSHSWRQHLFDIQGSMVRQIIYRVLACVVWAGLVYEWHVEVRPVAFPSTVHALVGVALGLLLVFRTNASYDRFWEGRRMWGSILNESRNLARAARPLLSPARFERVVRLTAAFGHATMSHLRGQPSLGPQAASLATGDVVGLRGARHLPVAIAAEITAVLDEGRRAGELSDFLFAMLDQNVQLLVDYLGACERIRKTPLPFAYVVHLRRALIVYCFTLPFALLDAFGWGVVPAVLATAYTFFGIEEIGVEIEDPFGQDDNDLPLEAICATISADLEALLPPTT